MKHQDKRANTRHTIRDDVTLVTPGMSETEPCILENVSMGGLKFFTDRELAVDDHVELRVPAPEDKPEIVIQARIIRIEPGDHGKPFCYACVIEDTENV